MALQPGRTTTAVGGRLGDRHMPGGRRPLGPANLGVTEDWVIGCLEDKGGSVLNTVLDYSLVDKSPEWHAPVVTSL